MAPPWPEGKDYIGTCFYCIRAFRGPKHRTRGSVCYECDQKGPIRPSDAAEPQREQSAIEKFCRVAEELARNGLERVETQKSTHDSGRGAYFTIWGVPVPKPRQTRSDKWKQRPCVVRYREWADKAREAAGGINLHTMTELHIRVFIPVPKSYSKKRQQELMGQPHFNGGDSDNYLKAAGDSLFKQDKGLWRVSAEKRWDDGKGARVEVTVL